jgi:excisionase family DNA binding protein
MGSPHGFSFGISEGDHRSSRMTVPEIVHRLRVGRLAVYAMLEQGIIPGIRLGRRWIITRNAYEHWERTCGVPTATGFSVAPEVSVVN